METPSMHQSPPANPETAAGTPAELNENGKLKRKRQPRNTACQGCASLKMKCVSQDNGKCERCNRMNRDCVPAIPKSRKRQTLDGSEPNGTPTQDTSSASVGAPGPAPQLESPVPKKQPSAQQKNDTSALVLRHDLTYTGSKSFITLFSRGLGHASITAELLQGVDYNFVANSFTIFRQKTPYFPFVELSLAADVVTMVARRPALTLAVCTVAAASSPKIQDRLSQAFLHTLSAKAILSSECSLDLFTGLLVYLAWQHHYLPQQQRYQQLCLLAGMAADLGLYQPTLSPMNDPGAALERDRAFVGCYYLCSSLFATGYNKPNPFRWTDNLRHAAESAGFAGTLSTDRELVATLELSQAMDDLHEVLQEHSGSPPRITQYLELHTKSAFYRLKSLKREHPSLGTSLGYAATNLHIYRILLLRSGPVSDPTSLIQCACAVKEYVDDILARPASTLHHIAIVDWMNLLEILLLMVQVSKASTNGGGWEAGALTSMLQPEVVLDAICYHMSSVSPNDALSSRHAGLLNRFRGICDGIKRRFLSEVGSAGVVTAQADDVSGNRPAPAVDRSTKFDAYGLFENGVLDPMFWNGLMGG